MNFESFPAEFSPPGLGLEGEILVTPLSPSVVDLSGFFEMTMVEFYSHALIDHWETLTKIMRK